MSSLGLESSTALGFAEAVGARHVFSGSLGSGRSGRPQRDPPPPISPQTAPPMLARRPWRFNGPSGSSSQPQGLVQLPVATETSVVAGLGVQAIRSV
jgi:hypothetical protein